MSLETDDISPQELERLALSTPPTTSEDDGSGIDLCPCCLKEVVDSDSLCPSCGAPVSSTAGIGPWERTLAEGYIYRSAVASPRKPIVVLGIWAIFMPTLLICGFFVFEGYQSRDYIRFAEYLFGSAVSAVIIFKTTLNYLKGQPETAKLS